MARAAIIFARENLSMPSMTQKASLSQPRLTGLSRQQRNGLSYIIEEAKVSFSLKGAVIPVAEPRSSYLDTSGNTVWLVLKAHQSEFPELIGEALQDFFGTPELREFVKDLLSATAVDFSRILARWQKRGLRLTTDQDQSSGSSSQRNEPQTDGSKKQEPHSPEAKDATHENLSSTKKPAAPAIKTESSHQTKSDDATKAAEGMTPATDRSESKQRQETQTQSVSDVSADLHDANTTTADVIPVRAHARSSPQRPRGEQTNKNRPEATSGLTSVSSESKTALEECGREFAVNKLEELGYKKVEQMGPQNPGFDLRAFRPGDTLKVEVKSHAREASNVFISQREYEEYRKTLGIDGETWELWNVENLAKSSGKTPTIQRVGHIPESTMKENGYWVDLSQCSHEPPKSGTPEPQ